ncbi:MAG: CehA/McbA family metallohydrolase, partial [Myxococcaceae bacterium]
AGAPGRDQLGKLGLLYAFGRTVQTATVEVLEDGEGGGPAVVAATGTDAVNDYLNLPNLIGDFLAGVKLVTDPDQPLPLRITTYFVLSPGEGRVRMLTAFCNDGPENLSFAVGELVDQGGSTDFFNPSGCTGVMGSTGCQIDPSPWFGYQGDDVAYAMRSYRFADPSLPEPASALLNIHGVAGTVAGGEGQQGLLTWVDPRSTQRPGTFGVIAGGQRNYLRDLFVGRDLGEIGSLLVALDDLPHGRLSVTVTHPGGAPGAGARVAVISSATGKQVTLLVADDAGKAKADLPVGGYKLTAALPGCSLPSATDAQVPSSGTADVSLSLGASRKLTVSVKDPGGSPLPAKVTVLCPGGPCALPFSSYGRFFDVEQLPQNVAAIALVPPQGSLELPLPPGQYQLVVTRGPEYSAWPDAWPLRGEPLDLSAADAQVTATLARVVDTTGWMSADLHVHAANSPDSLISNETRVLTFAAEGVDILCSTDHDFVTDYAPTIAALNAGAFLASMMGEEVTPFDFGHHQAYPVVRQGGVNGGAFDWAGGDGPTLRLPQLYAGLRAANPGVVLQLNHPRGSQGSLTQLEVDTATGASHADPSTFRMEPSPDATPQDTGLFSLDFDALEIQNGLTAGPAELNDWMTFLSRGRVKTATATSDTHTAFQDTSGYSRTFVNLGVDGPGQLDPAAFAAAMKAHRAVGTNSLFVRLTATRLDPANQPVGAAAGVGDTLPVNVAGGEKVELRVDVQAPEWLTFDTLEIYTHATGRQASGGIANTTPPTPLQSRKVDPGTLLEVVPGTGALTFRRLHVTETFTVSPTGDTWYLVVARGSSASPTLFPLSFSNTARAFAFTNAVLVDGDGSGAYDDFPLKLTQPLTLPAPPPRPVPRRVPTAEEVREALEAMLSDG